MAAPSGSVEPTDVYLCYSRADRAYVARLAEHLAAQGLTVWWDFEIMPGERFAREIQQRIRACGVFVLVLTPSAAQSKWVSRELHYADDLGKPIVPLLLEVCEPPLLVTELHREDVRDGGLPGAHFLKRLGNPGSETAERREDVLGGAGLMATLKALYPSYPLVELWGVTMPICEFAAYPPEWDDVESARGELLDRRVPGYAEYADDFDPGSAREAFTRYVGKYERSSPEERRRFFPGATYALRELKFGTDKRVGIDCTMGRYFTSLATSEDLDEEMMRALSAAPDEPVELAALPRRAWLHERVPDPVTSGEHRAAAVSHATVVMAANELGGYDVLLPIRSHQVATHASFNHVAPSGIFAPYDESSPSPLSEFSVRRNFYREWVEELYGLDDHERNAYALEIPDPEDEPEIQRLLELLEGPGRLAYTGVSVNLLTLRPEICLILLIDDPGWLRSEARAARRAGRPFQWGWEYETSPWYGEKRHNRPEELRLRLNAELEPAGGQRLEPSFLIPNAAAAISLAIQYLRTSAATG